MSKFDQTLMLPQTLDDYVAMRGRVLDTYKSALATLQLADRELEKFLSFGLSWNSTPRDSLTDVTHDIDRRLWRKAFDLTGFGQLMDAKAREDFERSLNDKPPEFTVENVRSIFLSTAQDAEEMFNRGLVNVFRRLSSDHRTNTNNAFKVNEKAVLGFMVTQRWGGGLEVRYGRARDEINDIDRVFKTLDNKKHQPRGLEMALNGALHEGRVYEDEYYQIKGFKNTNLHIKFKRGDLLDKANRIIHEYYHGSALAKNRSQSSA